MVTKVTASMLVVLPVVVLVDVSWRRLRRGAASSVGQLVGAHAVLWVTALPFAILGVFVGYMVNAETAYPVVIALMFVLGYFGGLFTPLSDMPHALRTAAQILPSYHQASLALALLSGQNLMADHWPVLAGYAAVLGLAIIWKHRREEARGLA